MRKRPLAIIISILLIFGLIGTTFAEELVSSVEEIIAEDIAPEEAVPYVGELLSDDEAASPEEFPEEILADDLLLSDETDLMEEVSEDLAEEADAELQDEAGFDELTGEAAPEEAADVELVEAEAAPEADTIPEVSAEPEETEEETEGDLTSDEESVFDPELVGTGSILSPTAITLGKTVYGNITTGEDADYYKIVLPSSGKLTLKATSGISRVQYHFYEGTQTNRLWYDEWVEASSVTGISTRERNFELTKGTYYFIVKRVGDRTGNYQFSFTFTSANESFAETGYGINNVIADAKAVTTGTLYRGQIAMNDDKDFYRVTLNTSGKFSVSFRANIYHVNVYLFNYAGNQVWHTDPYWSDSTQEISTTYQFHLVAGTYYFAVEKRGDNCGDYRFQLYFNTANESFAETATNVRSSLSDASSVKADSTLYYGQLALNDKKDFYKFTVPQSGDVRLSAMAQMYRVWYYIYNSDGTEVWKKTDTYWSEDTKRSTIAEDITLSAGTYYLGVIANQSSSSVNDHGIYSFKLTAPGAVNLARPKLIAAYNGVNGIGVNFYKVSNAQEYVIYRKYKGSWNAIRTLDASSTEFQVNGNRLMYTDTSVKYNYGEGYIYSVAAKRGSYNSGFDSKGVAIYRLDPPKNPKGQKSGSGRALISWGAVSCLGYEVQYYQTGTSTWNKCPHTSKTSQYVTGLTPGKTYGFRIRCYKTNVDRGTYYSEYTRTFYVTV